MNSKLYLSLMSIGTYGTRTCLNSIFLWTLMLSVFTIYPSFADKNLKDIKDEILPIPPTSESTSLFAQIFVIPKDGKAITVTIDDCDAQNKFMDDGTLYQDNLGQPRNDTITICPKTPWQTVKLNFQSFDVAAGDTLAAYDGDLLALKNNAAPFIGSGSGVGVSKAFGGWVAASCSPNVNPSGCLSFIFQTNGDFIKSVGWEAWVSCNDRNIVLTPPAIQNALLDCDETMATQTIGAATVTAACGTIANDSTIVRITNAAGKVCIDTCLSKNENMAIVDQFAIGTYLVHYKLKGDTTKTALTYFTVSAPNLVCNDNVRIPFGSACAIRITPDMVLENTCDTIQDTLYYQIKIKDGFGNILAAGTGRNGDYPMLSKDQVPSCSSSLEVEVTRVYYEGLNLTICNNGRQASTCSTNVLFFDNTPPIFTETASADTLYACDPNLTEEGLMVTEPTAIDNCAEVNVTFQGATRLNAVADCGITTYLVTWIAADECNNTATLKDTVRILRPGIDKIVKVADAFLSCGEDDAADVQDLDRTGVPGLMVGLQRNGVFVPTDTIALSTKNYVCNYILTKEDQRFPSTCGDKYFRYWTILDWCGSRGPMPIDTQAIFFKDTLAPTIQCTAFNTLEKAENISLPNFNCTRTVSFPTPTATDNCDLLPEVEMFAVEQLLGTTWSKLANNLGQAGALGAGTYRVGYRAFDQCPEQLKEDTCFRYFTLTDLTKPSAVCQDQLTVSLSNDLARIHAVDIDAGSWDACGIERILVRRQICGLPGAWQGEVNTYVQERLDNKLDPTGWASFVDFACCDLNQNVMVELLAIDRNGNFNFCWMEVTAVDKIDPICVNLPNKWDYCDNFQTGDLGTVTDTDGDQIFDNTEWLDLDGDLEKMYNEKYGEPLGVCVDNLSCFDLTVEQQYQLIDLECGEFKAKRRYRVRDQRGNVSTWAEQFINIEYRPDWQVTLPVDWSGTCGDGVPTANLIIENGSCDLMSYESFDQQFDVVNDACFKVIRTYHIINWCKYKAGDQPISINRISNINGEVLNSQTISSQQYGTASYFTYTQILKVDDTDAPIISVADVSDCIEETNGCSISKKFSATATDCNDASSESLIFSWEVFENGVIKGSGFGATFNWTVQPIIEYRVKWRVADKCGNSAWVENAYIFRDCVRPTPYCLAGLNIELGSNQEVEIWANDFDLNSTDNCTPQDKLDLRIWHTSLSEQPPASLAEVLALPTVVAFTCTQIGTQSVYVYAIDQANNYDFCLTTITVQDNLGICPVTGGNISGKIYTEFGSAVQDAEVRIENLEGEMMMTPSNGSYAFDLTGSSNYTVVPSKNNNVLNGVSTFDLVQITKHILGTEAFTSPYQHIAADVNASGEVSTFDIIQLRKLILNLSTEFPDDNPSWRFVDAGYNFTTEEPLKEAFPEKIEINNLSGTMPDLDFIAVKIGDINGSASASILAAAEDRTTTGALTIEVEDRVVKAGEIIEVAFDATDFENIEGYQFTLQYNNLELLDFIDGVATEANFGFALQDRGYLVTSWHNAAATTNAANAQLFRLKFKATTSGSLLSFLAINADFTASEAYQNDGELLEVSLQAKENTLLTSTFSLQQNTPNPFTNNTFIGFELPNAAAIELNILDMQGQIIQTKKGNYDKGQQQIEVHANELPNGTYYYQLVTPFGVAAKKMIVLK